MKTEHLRSYINENICVVLEGERNTTYFGMLVLLEDHLAFLENNRGQIKVQTKQIVAVSPFIPKKVSLDIEEEEELHLPVEDE